MLNPLNFLSKFIKSSNQRELDRIGKLVEKINLLEESTKKLADSEFPKKTQEFQNSSPNLHQNARYRNFYQVKDLMKNQEFAPKLEVYLAKI